MQDVIIWASNAFKESQEMSTLADRVPRTRKTTNDAVNATRSRIRRAVQKTIDFMLKNPEAAVDVWSTIESGMIQGTRGCDAIGMAKETIHDDTWAGKSLAKVSTKVKAKCFVAHGGRLHSAIA
jgi:ElaB/YqjD/DUF883 family membrane-anchored ribosome-binding protein